MSFYTQLEYKVVTVEGDALFLEDTVNRHAEKGWRLAAVTSYVRGEDPVLVATLERGRQRGKGAEE